jgi:hypothetical protein
MANSVNEQAMEDLTLAMQNIDIEIDETVLPLLNSSTKEIVLVIKKGEVGEIRPLFKIKK